MMLLRKSKLSSPHNQSDGSAQEHFAALGTQWYLDIAGIPKHTPLSHITDGIKQRLESFEQAYSRFRTDSIVGQITHKAGAYTFPDDVIPMWKLYEKLATISNNRFTPFIGSVVSAAGYDASYSLTTKSLHTPPSWDAVTVSLPSITAHYPVELDFGAVGKGYAVDLVANQLLAHSVASFLINAGGDIRHYSNKQNTARIGLEHPLNDRQAIGIITLQNQSLCGSASNHRSWGNFHHIIDPLTLSSPKHLLATWVVAENTMLADALATCLFLIEPDELSKYFEFSYIRLFADQSIEYSKTAAIEIF